ncbi:NB-ARC domain-containing protein [Fischerella sp. PCC 9605]|uniref:WD40 domain-containing protein n=1 Tax=Fischerella sp. PCC 9605 TaxID=1173024 RepID=UPI0004B592A1|nr:NB-ARC domain-containing protein [Fischerella sp. PCC 9605]
MKSKIPEDFLRVVAAKYNLSEAELEALDYALAGQTTKDIAATLSISDVAVRKRLGSVYQKFDISGSTAGKLTALRGILQEIYRASQITTSQLHQDWGEAARELVFYGRVKELSKLEQWITTDRCRLVAILGMGGIGKTALSIKLAEQLQNQFEYLIWRSLLNAPPLPELLADLIKFLSNQKAKDIPDTVDSRITQLIKYLKTSHCLLVLDNVESILQSGTRAGQYREGYREYGSLLKRIGESDHQSCLVLTSREKPTELATLEGRTLSTRSLQLVGLEEPEGREIFAAKGLSGLEKDQRDLIERYGGNPLALMMVSTTIQESFNGNIADFLAQGTAVFGDISDLVQQQFNRLSELEKTIMYWLAINREPVTLAELGKDIVPPVLPSRLLESLEYLERRSLTNRSANGFTLHNVILEYIVDRLVEQICEEIRTESFHLFDSHALIKATTKDFVRQSQIRFLLEPIADRLNTLIPHRSIEDWAKQTLSKLREQTQPLKGYTAGNVLNLLCHLKIDLKGYDFSDLTIRQAYLRGVSLPQVNLAHANFERSVFTETFSSVLSVAFSPDGERLAVGDANGEIYLWQVSGYQWLLTCKGHSDRILSIAFSPDGKKIVSCSEDKTVRLWDLDTGKCLKILKGHTSRVLSVAFSPDGERVASCSEDKTIRLWNWDKDEEECTNILKGHKNWVISVAFNPDGQIIASSGDDQTVRLWNVDTGKCINILKGHEDWVISVAFSPDGQILASGSDDQTVRLWKVNTGKCIKSLKEHESRIWSVAFSPDGQTLASGSEDKTVKLWERQQDERTGEYQWKYKENLQGHINRVRSVAFSPDGQTLASGSEDQTVKLWDVRKGVRNVKCINTLQGYTNQVWSVAFSPDGQTLASGSEDQTVRLWDVHTKECKKTLKGHTNKIWSVAFSPDGKTLASGSDDRTIRLWDVQTGKCLDILKEHLNWVIAVAFSPDGQTLASGSEDKTVKLWERQQDERTDEYKWKYKKTLQGHTRWVKSIAFSPDSQTLASGSADLTVKLWDLHTGKCETLEGHTNKVWSVAFSPQGNTLASGSEDQTIRLWEKQQNAHTGAYAWEHQKTLHEHTNRVWTVAFSPDGQTLASGSDDQTVRLWNVDTGRCEKTLEGHTNWIRSVTFSPDGQTLVSSDEDETIKFWDVKTGKCQHTLRISRPYEDMNIKGVTGLTEVEKASLISLGANTNSP